MINPGKIPRIPGDMDALSWYADGLRAAGQEFGATGGRVHATWQGLAPVYEAPEAEQLFAATAPVSRTADGLSEDVAEVARALSRYAVEVRPIQQRLERLREQAFQPVGEIEHYEQGGHTRSEPVASGNPHAPLAMSEVQSTNWRDDDGLVERHNQLNAEVAQAVADWMAAQRRCANSITSLVDGTRFTADDADGHQTANEFGYTSEQLSQAEGLPWGSRVETTPGVGELFAEFGHGVLDLAGLAPVIGEPADGINAAWYAAEGDHLNAGLSAASMIPLGGSAFTAGKFAAKGRKGADDAAEATNKAGVDLDRASSGRSFVTTARGTTFDIPAGWNSRTADNGKGIIFQHPGSAGDANSIRIMEPTARYPNGYVRYYNEHGQPLDINGKPGSKGATHIPEEFQGIIKGWPK